MNEMSEQLFHIAGYAGVACYITAYALLQANLIRGSGYSYTLLNLLAATLVLISLSVAFNMASAMIQSIWIVLSLYGLGRMAWLNRSIRFSPEEQDLIGSAFPSVPKAAARQFLNAGNWVSLPGGSVLLTEGEPVETLYYLSAGTADITLQGRSLTRLQNGLIGEVNVMSAGTASATVRLTEESRLFLISGDVLRRICRRDADLRNLIQRSLGQSASRKLADANRASVALGREKHGAPLPHPHPASQFDPDSA